MTEPPPSPFVATLSRAWRLIGTGLSFLIFGVGGLILGLVIFPALFLIIRSEARRQHLARRLVQLAMRSFVEIMRILGVLRYRVRGTEHIAGLHGHVIVANHPSLIDVVFLMAWFPQVECVIKRPLFNNPFTGAVLRAAGYIPNHDPVHVIKSCVDRLIAGSNLIVFPEGTRTVPGEPLAFKRGPASIALRAGASFLPVAIRCNPTTLTKAEPWYHIPRRRVFFQVDILPPVNPRDILDPELGERKGSVAMTGCLRKLLARASEQ